METDNVAADRAPINQFADLLGEPDPNVDPVEQSQLVLDSTGFFDFSFYEFLFPTEAPYQGILSEMALTTLDEFQVEAGANLTSLMLEILVRVEQAVREQVRLLQRRDWDIVQVADDLLEDFYRARASMLPSVVDGYKVEVDSGVGGLFLEFLSGLTTFYVRAHLYQAYPHFYGFWQAWPPLFDLHYAWWHQAIQPVHTPPPEPDSSGQDNSAHRTPPPAGGDHPRTGRQVEN